MVYKIHEIAEIAGVSVRTLHYYDEIGLLIPSQKTQAGYRLYKDDDIIKLQQIMMLKELGFPLKQIKDLGAKNVLSDQSVLIAQRTVLEKKRERLGDIITTLNNMINGTKELNLMNKKEMFQAFDMKEIEEAQKRYADEVREKYPKHVVDECNAKTSLYNKQDWQRIMEEQNSIFRKFASHLEQGVDSNEQQVQELVGVFQKHISDCFYTCDNECLLGLGRLYTCDERFTAFYEKISPGLAQYIQQAIQIYCD